LCVSCTSSPRTPALLLIEAPRDARLRVRARVARVAGAAVVLPRLHRELPQAEVLVRRRRRLRIQSALAVGDGDRLVVVTAPGAADRRLHLVLRSVPRRGRGL